MPTGATGFETTESLFIKGYPPLSGVTPLFMGPSQRENYETTLHTTGPASVEATLFVGFDQLSSGSASAYILGTQGFSGQPDQLGVSLTLKGMSDTPFSVTNTLTILAQSPVDDNSSATFFIESGPTPTGSGVLQFFAEGANPTVTNPVIDDSKTNLFIRNEESFDSNTTLFVEKDFNTAETTTLFLKSSTPSGVTTLYSSGIGVTTNSSNLLIKAPEVRAASLFSRGYN